jgi:dipeptidyl aminopeptidase/acylaminoacyl peptidase
VNVTNVRLFSFILLCTWTSLQAENAKPFDAASAFGARPSVTSPTVSPDGTSVAYIVPAVGQGSVAYTVNFAKGSAPRPAFGVDGKLWRLTGCEWAANDRLVCSIYGLVKDPTIGLMPTTRLLAVNPDGTNAKELSVRSNAFTRGFNLNGGDVIDWLPDQSGTILMTRAYLPDDHLGTHLASTAEGLGVDAIDTRTLAVKHIEPPRYEAVGYLTDGHGTVRIMSVQTMRGQQDTGSITHLYRVPGSREWQTLATYSLRDDSGFDVQAVDRDLNVAYGFKKKDGRKALYAIALDEGRREELVYARSDVDVDDLIRIGRRQRVVGTSYALERRIPEYLAPEVKSLMTALAKALPPSTALAVLDASVDESKMLIYGGSDKVPGIYYLFDRQSHHLDTLFVSRTQLEGATLAAVKPIKYPAGDGTLIPGYLILPAGHESAKGLPAIVLPHGGPSARDEWGFDWLAQFYVARGFAVLQPNYRGSSGYGDEWFEKNGFRSWPSAIGDVLDAGRWLVHEGADPNKLAIVGWSYGGYAALQSAVVDPTVFKAVIAIAPVTDLTALKEEHRNWSDFDLVTEYVGSGPHTHDGSPLEHADKIKAPVLLFHGALDHNVSIEQSKHMAARLTKAGDKCELVTWDDLDHQLDDSHARAEMLRKSDEFLRQTLGL